jgi:SAM-dependent methyltransferase
METLGYLFIGLILLSLFIGVAWRLSSRRRSLPCPVWLRWLVELDNPFAKTNRAAFIVWHLALEHGYFDRALLVTVLGEVPDQPRALREIFDALKPGGILSVTEIIFDPHFNGRQTVLDLADTVGFREKAFFGNRIAYTLHLEKPEQPNGH